MLSADHPNVEMGFRRTTSHRLDSSKLNPNHLILLVLKACPFSIAYDPLLRAARILFKILRVLMDFSGARYRLMLEVWASHSAMRLRMCLPIRDAITELALGNHERTARCTRIDATLSLARRYQSEEDDYDQIQPISRRGSR